MKARKILAMVMALALTAALAVGGTLAYLTSTKTVTNTFTIGKVGITMTETDVDIYGDKDGDTRVIENSYKLMPGHTYTKDPTIYVDSDSENSYLFVKVENQISAIEAAGTTTIASQMTAKGWVKVDGTDNVYCYYGLDTSGNVNSAKTAVAKGAAIVVFDSFKIADNADISAYAPVDNGDGTVTYKSIVVTAYAIQADGFENSTPADIWAKF